MAKYKFDTENAIDCGRTKQQRSFIFNNPHEKKNEFNEKKKENMTTKSKQKF